MHVLFICSANMCRSPMAEGYLKKLLAGEERSDIVVRSGAAFYTTGHPATAGARDTAFQHGFNIDAHESRFLDDTLYEWADIIFVMTRDHARHIRSIYGKKSDAKVRLLGEFDPRFRSGETSSPEVDDPYGGNDATYETVFDQIRRSINTWYSEEGA